MYYPVRKNTKLKNHDYSSESIYFITICTEARQYLLGFKEEEAMRLTAIGDAVEKAWKNIERMLDGILVDEYAIMPDHIHGILVFRTRTEKINLSKVIRDFKSFTTHLYYQDQFRITRNLWQRGYNEHVVRYSELDDIREYVQRNTPNWKNSRFFELEQAYLKSIRNENGLSI